MTSYTVLHVEDEPADRLILAAAFKKAAPNVQLKAVVDGEQAIAYLMGTGPYTNRDANPVPQLVLLDLKLPRRSGIEVLAWIRSDAALKELPVIMLTSSSEPADLDRAYALGANSYIVKTVDLASMREIARGIGEYAALAGTQPGAELPLSRKK
jgi:CheY-like chemotaxis protein